ncbi:MAG: HAD family phosphatase [Candidatus Moraniibacteriota bacterium]
MKKNIRRVLFDFDGTLFDTQWLTAEVESSLLATRGIFLDPEKITERYFGTRSVDYFTGLLGDRSLAEKMMDRKWELLMERFSEARPLGDLRNVFSTLTEKGIGISIGTTSPRRWPVTILEREGLLGFFNPESIIGGDMVAHGKPDPETWIRASLGADPSECIVVEDGISGVIGALSAGMRAYLLLPNRYPGAISVTAASDILDLIA